LLFGLDALRNGDDISRFGNSNDCLHDSERKVVVRDIRDEGLIDLNLVEWDALPDSSARSTRSEIIQRNFNAHLRI